MTLVVGASGQLGRALRRIVPDAVLLTRAELDLTVLEAIHPTLADLAPSAIINCAAYTDVDGAETDEAAATAVNCTAVGRMAVYAAEHEIPFVTFSSDYVFDGTSTRPYVESDPRNPINAYGRSKAAGEELALTTYPDTLIIRSSWLISGRGDDFVAKILRRARRRSIKVVDDQHGCPTIVDDLATAVVAALGRGLTGLLHLTNAGSATWFELARSAAVLAGIDPDRIDPCSSTEFPSMAKRPAYSILGSERRSELGVEPMPHWRESLPRVIERIEATSA